MRPLLAVVVPLLVLASWTVYHALVGEHGIPVELPISGYDPRDLLSGHFLRYQVEYGAPVCDDAPPDATRCLCLTTPVTGRSTVEWFGPCEERPSCEAWLRGSCAQGRLVAGVERFYFPETQTEALALVPPQATVVLRLDGRGGAQVETLRVGGKPLAAWLRDQKPGKP